MKVVHMLEAPIFYLLTALAIHAFIPDIRPLAAVLLTDRAKRIRGMFDYCVCAFAGCDCLNHVTFPSCVMCSSKTTPRRVVYLLTVIPFGISGGSDSNRWSCALGFACTCNLAAINQSFHRAQRILECRVLAQRV